MTIGQIGLLASVFSAMCIVGRIVFLYLFLTPVLGRVVAHDYDSDESRMERFSMMVTPGQTSWGDPSDVIPVRNVCTRVDYSYASVDYRCDLSVTVLKGWAPGPMIKLWIDTSDPTKVTARGPKFWFICFMLAGASTVGFSHLRF